MSGSNIINSVTKTLTLIELLDSDGEQGVTEISRKMGFEKSMVHRMLNTLKAKHYVRQNPDNLKYSNSYKLYEIGQNVLRRAGLPKMALRFMNELAAAAPQGSVNLAVREGGEAVYVEKVESAATIAVSLKIGQSLPLYCSATGKALLMFQARDQVRHLINSMSMEKHTANTIVDAEALLEELDKARERGFAIDDQEHLPGIRCAAAPVFDGRGQTIAALSVSSPAMAGQGRDSLEATGLAVKKTASDFTLFLGGRRPS